jgi:hypothetical protein
MGRVVNIFVEPIAFFLRFSASLLIQRALDLRIPLIETRYFRSRRKLKVQFEILAIDLQTSVCLLASETNMSYQFSEI